MQQFLADSPWDPALLVRACAERVVPRVGVSAWVVDDTGIPKDGRHSPGVKRQYSGTLGKIGNCQMTVSVHAVGERGTQPLGWALYLPEDWCADRPRRRKAKIPDELVFQTKPELAAALCEQAAGWEIARAPVLGDSAYGDNCEFRTGLHESGLEYVLSVSAQIAVFGPETDFAVPAAQARPAGRRASRPRPQARVGSTLAERLPAEAWQTVPCRTTPTGEIIASRFAFVRVAAAHPVTATTGRRAGSG